MDTERNQDETNKCDLDLDLVPYRGAVVFEKGEKSSVITVMIKQDDKEEETEFFKTKALIIYTHSHNIRSKGN